MFECTERLLLDTFYVTNKDASSLKNSLHDQLVLAQSLSPSQLNDLLKNYSKCIKCIVILKIKWEMENLVKQHSIKKYERFRKSDSQTFLNILSIYMADTSILFMRKNTLILLSMVGWMIRLVKFRKNSPHKKAKDVNMCSYWGYWNMIRDIKGMCDTKFWQLKIYQNMSN